ncbi:hypothetical protein Halhy_0291 [Haliscomenobacter hydrossis DSM 1100]|uniref:Uncharacterized protein n=1 Tax=Haliscomenobacter hydrossis (strain ATCC 27775 / DSM 1100 / LMG 10767 / O) TaxID=760192 RepID=F4KW05_HALH1|nr:hypothetical protein Halhy_0291 [Haliscomenobacter hydrossis DSM 1100]
MLIFVDKVKAFRSHIQSFVGHFCKIQCNVDSEIRRKVNSRKRGKKRRKLYT